jgi:hypothetical protein
VYFGLNHLNRREGFKNRCTLFLRRQHSPPPKIKDSFKKLGGHRRFVLGGRGNMKREKTFMDEIFTIDAVREVLTEGFSNAESGRKKSSNILPLVQEKRRGENFPPDVGY